MHAAQIDLDKKVEIQVEADRKHTSDAAAMEAARRSLATYQSAVDKLAASVYMGGRTDGLTAILTVSSPQNLIDKLAVQRVMATQMAEQMQNFRAASKQAAVVEAASAKSAADAKGRRRRSRRRARRICSASSPNFRCRSTRSRRGTRYAHGRTAGRAGNAGRGAPSVMAHLGVGANPGALPKPT